MFENLLKRGITVALPATMILISAGCKENEVSAPPPEPVDLTQTEDLFEAPIKPNPLANDPETVVVRVNDEDITRGEIMQLMDAAMQQVAGRVPPEQLQQFQGQIYNQVKNELINQKLVSQAVEAAGIEIDPAKVDETLAEIKSSIPEGQTLESILGTRGQDIESFKQNLVKDLAAQELLESKTAGISDATEEEAKEFYDANPEQFAKPESVSASHILIKVDPEDSEEAKAEKKAQLEKIREDIIAGNVTFQDAAAENSECPSSANGGDLGTFGKGRMVPEFEVAAFSQEVGEVGPVIETSFGYHIIKVSDHTEEGAVSFDEVKERLIAYLTNQKKQEAVSNYIAKLHEEANIEEM